MRAPGLSQALRLRVSGVVQGVGFRPFIFRLADELGISGWVLNEDRGVAIHAEGSPDALESFQEAIARRPPPAAQIVDIRRESAGFHGYTSFEIRSSTKRTAPSTRISPDLPVCEACLEELFDPADRRFRYPYINCTNCGPRYSIVHGLPYDRQFTTMAKWPMCERCRREYEDPRNRRFHAQPVACWDCGPQYVLHAGSEVARGVDAMLHAARLLRDGAIVAIKGLGGYHLACDARDAASVSALRSRKYRKDRPFAVMVRTAGEAKALIDDSEEVEVLLPSPARPIVLARAHLTLEGVAPDNVDLGVMLAYTPVHHLLFDAGAPPVLVMTSANRSSEPIAYRDDDARTSLAGIADAMLTGEREIARRIDDSVVRAGHPSVVLRHARGLAPGSVATLPTTQPILALGADLKNAVALVVGGQAFVSQHIGDLEHYEALRAFRETIVDLCALYELTPGEAIIAYDAHPEYASSTHARELPGRHIAVQHHRAHIASVLAEHQCFEQPVLGFAFDGTGYGEDGTIWGGEVFTGSLQTGLARVAHLRAAQLAGGDAAARFPVQAAAGFLTQIDMDFSAPPFVFPHRYLQARELLRTGVRVFATTSMGRLFDTVAALLGFVHPITFEGQAAMWTEHLARSASDSMVYAFPFEGGELDYRPLLEQIVCDRRRGVAPSTIARGFHDAVVRGMLTVCDAFEVERVVVSGGVFQNSLLVEGFSAALGDRLLTNCRVPPNDGGICLGQAAVAALLH